MENQNKVNHINNFLKECFFYKHCDKNKGDVCDHPKCQYSKLILSMSQQSHFECGRRDSMLKGYLIIDIPESCDECTLFHSNYSDMSCGGLNNRIINYPYPKDFRQSWCPIKPLPEKEKNDLWKLRRRIWWWICMRMESMSWENNEWIGEGNDQWKLQN